jgi:hypothetical protein
MAPGVRNAVVCMVIAIVSRAAFPVVRDLDGRLRRPFEPSGTASLLIFVTSDCPISNGYAPEIRNVCSGYAPKGVDCLLVYEDPGLDAAAARDHLAAYRYGRMAAAIDRERAVARAAMASVTPEAVLIGADGAIRYRGRIDNLHVAPGRRRPAATVHDLRDALDAVVAGRKVAQPVTEAVGCFITPPRSGAEELK